MLYYSFITFWLRWVLVVAVFPRCGTQAREFRCVGFVGIDQAPAGLTQGLKLSEQKPQYVCAFACLYA